MPIQAQLFSIHELIIFVNKISIMKKSGLLLALIILSSTLIAQQVQVLVDKLPASFRGLSVVSDDVIWLGGSKGTVGRSIDGGQTWTWNTVKGFETREFRDIEAFDENTAVVLAIAEPAHILRTIDGGKTWTTVYENKTKGMFLDAMDFFDDQNGTVIGDPVGGKFFIARTHDGGLTWKEESSSSLPKIDSGEACFASSGTNIRMFSKSTYGYVSGGTRSRFFVDNKPLAIPIVQGFETAGANSMAARLNKKSKSPDLVIAVGGDFLRDTVRASNCFYSNDLGKTWKRPSVLPFGYRSCVEFITDKELITCGPKGVDLSSDEGRSWRNISSIGFHVCRRAKKGKKVFLAGRGLVGQLVSSN
jgi:photosystem II stability/assembly factor-like uncharacterized protein